MRHISKLASALAAIALIVAAAAPAKAESIFDLWKKNIPAAGAQTPPAAPPETPEPPAVPAPGYNSASGDFDFYVFSLSWSSGFCDNGGQQKAGAQCRTGAGLGFVVHGLWPQYTHGFPQNCGPDGRSPSRAALESVADLYPDVGLARYEWRKHGTCSGKSPEGYFADVRRAAQSLSIPENFKHPTEAQQLDPRDIARAFIAQNRGLRADMMAVGCQRGALQEVRVCYSKDMRGFTSCPDVARGSCRTQSVSVAPVR